MEGNCSSRKGSACKACGLQPFCELMSSKLRLFATVLPSDVVCWCMTGLEVGFRCLQGENFKLCSLMLLSITCYFCSFPAGKSNL